MKSEYVAKDIQVIEGLNAVRERPGMYIGGTGSRGLHHILWEIIDNSMDEIANGFGKSVTVIIYEDNSASVEDDGRGIPVDNHPKLGVSGVEVVFTTLHAGGKFDTNSYTFSGGLHGVGASVTNALSRWLDVTVFKDGKLNRIMKKTNEKGKILNFFRTKKFINETYKEDLIAIIDKYNEFGYRDMVIDYDSITRNEDNTVNIKINIEEGRKYYLGNISWIGNSIYPGEFLGAVLRLKKGDVFNQKLLDERLST
ncbi:hypothetical protein EOM82_06865, partial [bacterium]|nr:hypothetical protein [bacterium]